MSNKKNKLEKGKTFRFGVHCPGDRSVGINPAFVNVDLHVWDEHFLNGDDDLKAQFIEEFKAFLAPWMDEPEHNVKTHEEWEQIAKDEFEAERMADEAEAAMENIADSPWYGTYDE